MRSAFIRQSSPPDRAKLSRRTVAFVLALIVHLLVLILLLRQAPPPPLKVEERMPTTFALLPEAKKEAAQSSAAAKTKHIKSQAAQKSPAPVPAPPIAQPPPFPWPLIAMDKEQFAAGDIANLPSHKDSSGSAGAGQNSGSAYGPGEGPGGAQLYDADWYRKPSDAELASYLPDGAPAKGWGLIACKTVEHNHVDNCQTLGESPLGSGFARAVRLAAWQFLIVPPRINGRPIIGAWVRIRIDYTQRSAS